MSSAMAVSLCVWCVYIQVEGGVSEAVMVERRRMMMMMAGLLWQMESDDQGEPLRRKTRRPRRPIHVPGWS